MFAFCLDGVLSCDELAFRDIGDGTWKCAGRIIWQVLRSESLSEEIEIRINFQINNNSIDLFELYKPTERLFLFSLNSRNILKMFSSPLKNQIKKEKN